MSQLPPQYQPKRAQSRPHRHNPLPLLAAAAVVYPGLTLTPSLGRAPGEPTAAAGPPATTASTPTAAPMPESAPEPTPTPESIPTAFDFTRPASAAEAMEMDYFASTLSVGDFRTGGLCLCSGTKGADLYYYEGLTVFEMDDRTVVELDGGRHAVEQTLERGPQYARIYISLGTNELGYFNNEAFRQTFGDFPKQVKASQPGAIVYLENLVPVNAEKCTASKQPYYVDDDQVAAYNAIFPQLAKEYQIVLLDVTDTLTDESGILPADATTDGVCFTKVWYQRWLAYPMGHTVNADYYAAGQTAVEGANET